jgi:hypothetical protein
VTTRSDRYWKRARVCYRFVGNTDSGPKRACGKFWEDAWQRACISFRGCCGTFTPSAGFSSNKRHCRACRMADRMDVCVADGPSGQTALHHLLIDRLEIQRTHCRECSCAQVRSDVPSQHTFVVLASLLSHSWLHGCLDPSVKIFVERDLCAFQITAKVAFAQLPCQICKYACASRMGPWIVRLWCVYWFHDCDRDKPG